MLGYRNLKPLVTLTLGLMLALPAQAALYDRGAGLLYDDVLNITWTQNASYAPGSMTWFQAQQWAADLSYYDDVRGVTYDDWRLPKTAPVGADWNYGNFEGKINDGTVDYGYNITSPNSELSYMYYVNLGLKGEIDVDGTRRTDWGIFGNGYGGGFTYAGQTDVGLVKNLQAALYWSETTIPVRPEYRWSFYTSGAQTFEFADILPYGGIEASVWVVRDGDIAAAIPEPETYALMLGGLALVFWTARKRRVDRAN